MPLEESTGLTPEEQRFFETGVLNSNPAGFPDTTPDPVAQQGLSTGAPAPAPAPVAPPATAAAPAPATPTDPAPQLPDVAEILRRNLADAQQRVAELEIAARQAAAPKAPDAGPDPATDPLGALMHKLEQMNTRINELQQHSTQATNQTLQQQQFAAFRDTVNSLKVQFAATTPDFDAAYQHLRNQRIADLRSYGLTDANIQQTILREEVALAEAAINNGKNPAAVIYEMSKRHGYVTQAPAATPTPPAQKLDQIAAAQAAARTLPSSPTTDPDVTLESLKAASDADLNKMVLDDKLWNKIAGNSQYPL